MTFEKTLLLGTIAGLTIFLGLPIGRVGGLSDRARAFVSVLAGGILLFIFYDVMGRAHGELETSLAAAKAGGSWGALIARGGLVAVGLVAGSVGLAYLERWILGHRTLAPVAGGAVDATFEAGIDVAALARRARESALRLGMLIAIAIGLHNFSEGLAIGVSARAGEVGLAGTLIVGFALHNATEGFGIVGPLGGVRPSWRWLLIAGLAAGAPTIAGTALGFQSDSPLLELAFFALAGGAILYVLGQIWTTTSARIPSRLVLWGIVLGFLAGLASDMVITYGGG